MTTDLLYTTAREALQAFLSHLFETDCAVAFGSDVPESTAPLASGVDAEGRAVFALAVAGPGAAGIEEADAERLAAAFAQASAVSPGFQVAAADAAPQMEAGEEQRAFEVETPKGVLVGVVQLVAQEPAADAAASAPGSVRVAPAAFADLGPESLGPESGDGSRYPASFDLLREVELEITVELGRRSLPLAQVLRLAAGSVVELDHLVGEPLGIYANGHLIAEGEAVVLGEQLGVRVTRLVAEATQALRPA